MEKSYSQFSIVRPIFRKAILYYMNPKLSYEEALQLSKQIENDWGKSYISYMNMISEVSDSEIEALKFDKDENIIVHEEDQTIVITFPRIRGKNKMGIEFDSRICIALCTGKMSSKGWARTGVPYIEDTKRRVDYKFEMLQKISELFLKITEESIEWSFKRMHRLLQKQSMIEEFRIKGYLDIRALGVKNEKFLPYFEQLNDLGLKASKLFQDSEASSLFSKYYNVLLNGNGKPLNMEEFDKMNWFSSPISGENMDGYFTPSHFLYFIQPFNLTRQIIGIGYDNSFSGDISHKSTLKVARWIGRRV